MNEAIKAIITLDVINHFSDRLNERIKEAAEEKCIYIGDALEYTTQMFLNNGLSPEVDSPQVIFDTLQHVLCYCFITNNIDGVADYSDDKRFVFWS